MVRNTIFSHKNCIFPSGALRAHVLIASTRKHAQDGFLKSDTTSKVSQFGVSEFLWEAYAVPNQIKPSLKGAHEWNLSCNCFHFGTDAFLEDYEIHGESWEFFWGACGRCGATHRTTLPVFDGFRNIPRVHCTTRAFTKPSLSWRKPSHKWNKSCSCLHFDTKTFSEDFEIQKKIFFCKWKTCK